MCAPQNGIISHIITYHIIYHENPDLSTSFSIFLPFFIFSGTYRKQCGANAVFCAFCAVWGGIFIPPEYRLSAPAPKIGCPVSATTANRASSIADRQNRKHALYPVSARTPQCRHPNSNTLSRRRQHTCSAYVLIPAFSFAYSGAKEKAIKKKTPL